MFTTDMAKQNLKQRKKFGKVGILLAQSETTEMFFLH